MAFSCRGTTKVPIPHHVNPTFHRIPNCNGQPCRFVDFSAAFIRKPLFGKTLYDDKCGGYRQHTPLKRPKRTCDSEECLQFDAVKRFSVGAPIAAPRAFPQCCALGRMLLRNFARHSRTKDSAPPTMPSGYAAPNFPKRPVRPLALDGPRWTGWGWLRFGLR